MGGKALTNTRRITTIEMESIIDDISKDFNEIQGHFEVLKSLPSKMDHGDIDFIIDSSISFDTLKRISLDKGVQEIKRNGDSLHISWPIGDGTYVQVDFSKIDWSSLENARTFLWYGDLGNLIGKIVRGHFSNYLRWSYHGLNRRIWTETNDHLLQKLHISSDAPKILDLFGFDYSVWERGFQTEEDVFEFVLSSSLFNSEYFNPENLRHDQKEDYKRPGYLRFLEWMKLHDKKSQVMRLTEAEVDERILSVFGVDTGSLAEQLRYEWSLKKLAHSKLSGKHIMMLYPDMKGAEIGRSIDKVRESIGGETVETWKKTVDMSEHEITELIHNILSK